MTLAVALLLIRQTVVLVGQRAQRLDERAKVRRLDRKLARFGDKEGTCDLEPIPQINLFERVVAL